MDRPVIIEKNDYRFDAFSNGEVLLSKKKNHLPAMGWNSWNAFGSGNTEALTKVMADKIVELGLDKLGYKYVVLDDGCYKPERVGGVLSNEEVKFPGGFRSLADYIHGKGLKFGMYNDIGTNLCAGAKVGTCGYEKLDAKTYLDWGVDFIKVDNCYYLWDNATFSNPENARYTYAPNIKSVKISGNGTEYILKASAGTITGKGAFLQDDYVTGIGTFDGTGPEASPIGDWSGELSFAVNVAAEGEYEVSIEYATGKEPLVGEWLQLATGKDDSLKVFYDDELPATDDKESFVWSKPVKVAFKAGENTLRLMNHRRQENTLNSYAALLEGFNEADASHDIILSICEWGKTGPHNWGYKVGDSWRILNDITFQVGADGNPGRGSWTSDYTTSVCAQYNKAVISDEFAGLDKGWNDPDMLMIGMDGLDETMCRTHMAMWCMMNSPLMLGLDLRRVEKNDWIYNIISNKDLIALNQDSLGVQAKRVYSTKCTEAFDTTYIRDNDRVDVLAKPLSDGSLAIMFVNLSENVSDEVSVSISHIHAMLAHKMVDPDALLSAKEYELTDLFTKDKLEVSDDVVSVNRIEAHGSVVYVVRAK